MNVIRILVIDVWPSKNNLAILRMQNGTMFMLVISPNYASKCGLTKVDL